MPPCQTIYFRQNLDPVRTLSDVFAWQGISLRDPEIGPEPEPAALHGSLRETPCQAFTASADVRPGINVCRTLAESRPPSADSSRGNGSSDGSAFLEHLESERVNRGDQMGRSTHR